MALIVFGMVVIAGKTSLPAAAGYAFLLFGVVDALVMPVVLARRWKSPPR